MTLHRDEVILRVVLVVVGLLIYFKVFGVFDWQCKNETDGTYIHFLADVRGVGGVHFTYLTQKQPCGRMLQSHSAGYRIDRWGPGWSRSSRPSDNIWSVCIWMFCSPDYPANDALEVNFGSIAPGAPFFRWDIRQRSLGLTKG